MKNFFYLLFIFSSLLLLPHSAIAVENNNDQPTPTKPSAGFEEIQKIRDVVQEKVKEKLKQITTFSPVKKGIIGTVIQVDPTQITIEYKNSNRILILSSDTVFIDLKRNKVKIDQIKIGQEILAMGTLTEKGTIEAKRIVFVDLKPLENKFQIVIGKIVDVSQSSSIFVLIPNNNKNIQYQIKTDTKTDFSNPENTQKLDLKTLKSGQKIIVVIKPDEKIIKTFYAAKIINLESQSSSSSTSSSSSKSSLSPSPTKEP